MIDDAWNVSLAIHSNAVLNVSKILHDDEHPMDRNFPCHSIRSNGNSPGGYGNDAESLFSVCLSQKAAFSIALMSRTASSILGYRTVANYLGISSLTDKPSV